MVTVRSVRIKTDKRAVTIHPSRLKEVVLKILQHDAEVLQNEIQMTPRRQKGVRQQLHKDLYETTWAIHELYKIPIEGTLE